MLLFVGLGNPGSDFAKNRHNAGFIAVDRLAQQHGFSIWRAKSGALIADGCIGTEKVFLVKPQSFMNKSGLPVAEIARFYKISVGNIFFFMTRSTLQQARCGLNRAEDMVAIMASAISIGISALTTGVCVSALGPPMWIDVKSWVLMDFAKDELEGWLADLAIAMADEANRLVNHDTEGFQSRVAFLAPAKNSGNNRKKT